MHDTFHEFFSYFPFVFISSPHSSSSPLTVFFFLLRFIEKKSAKKKKKKFCTFWFASAYICLGLINFLWVQRSEFIIYFISLKRVDNRFFAFLFASRATCCSCCCRFARAAFFSFREKLTIEVNDNRFGSALSHFVNEKKKNEREKISFFFVFLVEPCTICRGSYLGI